MKTPRIQAEEHFPPIYMMKIEMETNDILGKDKSLGSLWRTENSNVLLGKYKSALL
jgi:hypothetical protein